MWNDKRPVFGNANSPSLSSSLSVPFWWKCWVFRSLFLPRRAHSLLANSPHQYSLLLFFFSIHKIKRKSTFRKHIRSWSCHHCSPPSPSPPFVVSLDPVCYCYAINAMSRKEFTWRHTRQKPFPNINYHRLNVVVRCVLPMPPCIFEGDKFPNH